MNPLKDPNIGKYLTTCRHCPQQFRSAAFDMPVFGEQPPERLMKFVMGLADHMNGKHRDIMKQVGGTIQDFTGIMILNQFAFTDPALEARADAIRADVHKRTRRYFYNDAAILDLVSRLGLDPEQEQTVGALMRAMRDTYEELGEWSPEKQAEKRVQMAV